MFRYFVVCIQLDLTIYSKISMNVTRTMVVAVIVALTPKEALNVYVEVAMNLIVMMDVLVQVYIVCTCIHCSYYIYPN